MADTIAKGTGSGQGPDDRSATMSEKKGQRASNGGDGSETKGFTFERPYPASVYALTDAIDAIIMDLHNLGDGILAMQRVSLDEECHGELGLPLIYSFVRFIEQKADALFDLVNDAVPEPAKSGDGR